MSAPHDPAAHTLPGQDGWNNPVEDILDVLRLAPVDAEHLNEVSRNLLALAEQASTPDPHGCRHPSTAEGEHHLAGHDAESHPIGAVAQALANTRLEVLAVGRAARLANEAQRKALAVRDRGCVVAECGRPPGECQVHHVRGWARGGPSDIDNFALLCWAHHRAAEQSRLELFRNPDPLGPHWIVVATPAHRWAKRAA